MLFEKESEKYAQDMAKYYESAHGYVPSQFEKYLRKAVEYGYNKANEWHKADEKPKVTKEYLVYLISGYNCRSVTMMIYNVERGFWCADNQSDVVYWKEIVLPELKES